MPNTNVIDEIGNKHGRLVAVERVGSTKNRKATWLCECECGNTTIVTGIALRRGETTSCGCNLKLPAGEAMFNAVYSTYARSAKVRGHKWSLTKKQFREIVARPCHYCGDIARSDGHHYQKYTNGVFAFTGVDRVDNSIGYVLDNCVPCCKSCNVMKGKLHAREFVAQVGKIHTQQRLKSNSLEEAKPIGEDISSGNLRGYVLCPCGTKLIHSEQVEAHRKEGHFDHWINTAE